MRKLEKLIKKIKNSYKLIKLEIAIKEHIKKLPLAIQKAINKK